MASTPSSSCQMCANCRVVSSRSMAKGAAERLLIAAPPALVDAYAAADPWAGIPSSLFLDTLPLQKSYKNCPEMPSTTPERCNPEANKDFCNCLSIQLLCYTNFAAFSFVRALRNSVDKQHLYSCIVAHASRFFCRSLCWPSHATIACIRILSCPIRTSGPLLPRP